jgi:hypothetical protein
MKNVLVCLGLLCLCVAMAFGQANNGTLSGTVADVSGAVLPGVTVTATNTATGVVATTISNEAGTYNIPGLIPGPYTLSAELPGFQKETLTNVTLNNGITVRLNFSLKVATQSQSVEVTVTADTILSTSSPTIGQGLTERKVVDLPLLGGNVLDYKYWAASTTWLRRATAKLDRAPSAVKRKRWPESAPRIHRCCGTASW